MINDFTRKKLTSSIINFDYLSKKIPEKILLKLHVHLNQFMFQFFEKVLKLFIKVT